MDRKLRIPSLYCQNRECPQRGKKVKTLFEVEFFREEMIVTEVLRVCHDCKKLNQYK